MISEPNEIHFDIRILERIEEELDAMVAIINIKDGYWHEEFQGKSVKARIHLNVAQEDSQEVTYVGRAFTDSRCSASFSPFAFLRRVVRRTHWFPRYVTNAIDRESGSRGSLGSAPAVVETRNGSRARTLFPCPTVKTSEWIVLFSGSVRDPDPVPGAYV